MRLSKRTITGVLIVHIVASWTAVVLRIDRFPLTWAPMYSLYEPQTGSTYVTTFMDPKKLRSHGWRVVHRDGSTSWLRQGDLNVPRRSMWRLYYQRTYGQGPPKHRHANHDAGTIDRYLWGLEPGEKFQERNWARRLLVSINRTLGYEPDDPKFIVAAKAESERFVFDLDTFELEGRVQRNAVVEWEDTWAVDFR